MDRSWIFADRLSDEYERGVDEFIAFAVENTTNKDRIFCPCWKCGNTLKFNQRDVKDHLIITGFKTSYTCWTKHGEARTDNGSQKPDHYTNILPEEDDVLIQTLGKLDHLGRVRGEGLGVSKKMVGRKRRRSSWCPLLEQLSRDIEQLKARILVLEKKNGVDSPFAHSEVNSNDDCRSSRCLSLDQISQEMEQIKARILVLEKRGNGAGSPFAHSEMDSNDNCQMPEGFHHSNKKS